jgi:hypothetical protein
MTAACSAHTGQYRVRRYKQAKVAALRADSPGVRPRGTGAILARLSTISPNNKIPVLIDSDEAGECRASCRRPEVSVGKCQLDGLGSGL